MADLFTEKADELGRIITREMGKATDEAHGEAEFSGEIFRYYANNAEELLRDIVLDDSEDSRTVVQHQPLGALLGIMTWNYPYDQVARSIAPNLALGNTILIKHAECGPESALAIQQILDEAGVPGGVCRNLFATHGQVASLIEDSRICGVPLTGSEKAGASIGEKDGRNLKKSVLELGGSDP
ncbi:aldehyde dehydrogenase family protein [Corynebacterium glyciniphilum]|uniref:aldehyde dehydrogenase family protein n=1 Tax=Corynebacterium glyciniphilum TaxID=1404244 RepID=UPI003FD335B9